MPNIRLGFRGNQSIEDLPFDKLKKGMNFQTSMQVLGLFEGTVGDVLVLDCTQDTFTKLCEILLEFKVGGICKRYKRLNCNCGY